MDKLSVLIYKRRNLIWCVSHTQSTHQYYSHCPMGKISEKLACRSVLLTIWHCILSIKLTKTYSFRVFLWRFCPLGGVYIRVVASLKRIFPICLFNFHFFSKIFQCSKHRFLTRPQNNSKAMSGDYACTCKYHIVR